MNGISTVVATQGSRDYATVRQSSRVPTRRWLLLPCVLIGIVTITDRPRAQGPAAAFHAVGHLPGARASSIVRDATRAGGVIYAVGGAAARACGPTTGLCGDTDTAVLWTSTTGTLEALSNLVPNTTSTTPHTAYDITPDAAFIASQARSNATNGRVAVRVTTSSLTNLNLAAAPFPALPAPLPPLQAPLLAAVATSSDGMILYGSTNAGTFNPPNFPHRGVHIDADGKTSAFIPFVSPGDTWNPVAERGSSADGSVAVGSSFPTPTSPTVLTNHKAYRYVHGSPGVTTAIPFLPGGTFNDALAVSPDGDLVLVTGNSTANPNGEAYFYRASTGATQPLGSPNAPWSPGARLCKEDACLNFSSSGGMTADGSVVVMSLGGADNMSGYFRNAHGWFHLTSALAANGVDFVADGWDTEKGLRIHGISSDGTLVFGAGVRNDNFEGFVADVGPGVLASFNPQPAPPASSSLVGVWTFVDPGDPAPTDPDHVVVFTADGVYYHIEGEPGEPLAGFERGLYTFNGSQLAFTTLFDTNGSTGLSDTNGSSFSIAVSGDTLIADGQVQAYRIAGSPGSIVGGWVGEFPGSDSSLVVAFTDSRFFQANDDGSELGTYTWDPVSHQLDLFPAAGTPDIGNFASLTPEALGLFVIDDGGDTFTLSRVIDPATIPVIANPPLSASGVVGTAFTYDVTATNAVTFSASGLPDGLTINSSSGTATISGTPTVGGQFAATILATNAAGVSDIETLTLTIAIPTPVGQNVVVEPEVPAGVGPVTLSFGEITAAGQTTVAILDESELPAPPPGGFSLGGLIYDVETTATFSGLITVCFSYAGIDFGMASPRLIHYENNAWEDITTSVDDPTKTICGATSSLSPFAILISPILRTGFSRPVSMVPGHLNRVTGGSTVPLKFNAFVNGVEKTTTAGLAVTAQRINCNSGAPEGDKVDVATSRGTSLRYAGRQYIQNWKVPKTPGCYMVRMTTEQDGLALTARFKVR